MVKDTYDRKKLTILRAVLIAVGAGVGFAALWQYFVFYPDVLPREIQIVVIVVSSAALAALLGLSAKPFYRLGASVAEQFLKLVSGLGAKGVTAVVAGFAAAGLIGFLFDLAISYAVTILAVRVLADVIVIAVVAALCCYGFLKWMRSTGGEETAVADKKYNGYLLTASCFFDDRVYAAAEFLCNAKITSNTFKAVWKYGDNDALERLKIVSESGAVGILRCNKPFDSAAEYTAVETAVASSRRLKKIAFEGTKVPDSGEALELGAFAVPDSGLKAALVMRGENARVESGVAVNIIPPPAAAESESEPKQSAQTDADGQVNGQIIIDK